MGSSAPDDVEILFVPAMMAGHLRPMMNMANLFTERGAKASVVVEPSSSQRLLDWSATSGHSVRLLVLSSSSTSSPEGTAPFQELLRRHVRENSPPACVVFDAFLPWVVDIAEEFSVPAFTFHGSSCLTSYAYAMLARHPPSPKCDSFLLPGLSHRVELLKTELPDLTVPAVATITSNITASKSRSTGLLMNTFSELEAEYLGKVRQILGKDVLPVGPLPVVTETSAGEAASCLKWLDGKEPKSVTYICFGTTVQFSGAQLREIAAALEEIGRPFLWIVKGLAEEEIVSEKKGNQSLGLIVTCWAPQTLILTHGAVGAFVTHCGWNSCIEAMTAGVPMVTWPQMAEQFFNEKLVTQVLGAGVGVGSRLWAIKAEDRELIGRDDIRRAIERVIGEGEEAAAVRKKAVDLAASARMAVAEGGSSYQAVGHLIEQLRRGEWRHKNPPSPPKE